MNLKRNDPTDIYKRVNDELLIIIHSMSGQSSDEIINKAENEARNQLEEYQKKLSSQLDSLQRNAEWNTFTIAFYGETGAGKSTLIETLRILLKESTKVASQKKYREQYASYQADIDKVEQTKVSIENNRHSIEKTTIEIASLDKRYSPEREKIQQVIAEIEGNILPKINEIKHQIKQKEYFYKRILQETDDIKTQIIEYKKHASLWQKIILFFKNSPEEVTLDKLQKQTILVEIECKTLQQQYDTEKQLMDGKLSPLYAQLTKTDENQAQETLLLKDKLQFLENENLSFNKKLSQLETHLEQQRTLLMQYTDGEIIGDGRADFTRETQRYYFKLKENTFSLLDVPGIEGKEALVAKEIENAVERAHAVFYITNKAAPPQTGDNERKGTLEKIKQHLNAQTEVWSIFNKKVTNPKLALKNKPLLSDDELTSLSELDKKMSEHLGRHYKRTVSLTALPAFLVSTDCLMPHSQNAKRRIKILHDFMAEELLERSGVLDFIHLLENELLPDSQNKIYQANLNKAKEALDNTTNALDIINKNYKNHADSVSEKCEDSKSLLDSSFLILKKRLSRNMTSQISSVLQKIRTEVYSQIEENIKNDRFKHILEQKITEEFHQLSTSLPHVIKQQIECFQIEAKEIFERYEEQVQDLMSITDKLNRTQIGDNIDIKIKIDSGINKAGLLGALAGLALVPFTAGASIWVAGASALTALISIGKAVIGFFNSRYKMSQQKKSTDDNLRRIEPHINETIDKHLAHVLPKIEGMIEIIKQSLDEPVIKARQKETMLKNSNKKLKNLSQRIQIEGHL